MMNRPKQPCKKDCPDRSAECHAVCEKWTEYSEIMKTFYKVRADAYNLQNDLNEIERARIKKIKSGNMKRRRT